MSTPNSSPNRLAWRRFRRHVPGMLGLGYVIMCMIVGLCGYLLAPDNSTHANFQVLELAKQAPGTEASVLLLPQPMDQDRNWLEIFFSGDVPPGIPIALDPASELELTSSWVKFTRISGVSDSLALSKFGVEDPNITEADFEAQYVIHRTFWLGTDSYGRDLLSRIMLGTRVSLTVGLMSVLISLCIGILMGTMAGYFGGWVDRIIMWLVSVLWSIPTLLMALALAAVLGRGFWQLFVAIGISMWVEVARLVRGQILATREQPYVEAAQSLGYSSGRIMWRHILPNVFNPIIVIAVANFGAAVLIESGLSFLGLGVEVPIPTWGRMVNEGYTYLVFEAGQWLAIYPGLALVLLIVSVNLVGIGLRDAFDLKN